MARAGVMARRVRAKGKARTVVTARMSSTLAWIASSAAIPMAIAGVMARRARAKGKARTVVTAHISSTLAKDGRWSNG